MPIRVRSLAGAELSLEISPLTVRVGIAEIKRHALAELLRLRAGGDAEAAKEEDASSRQEDVERKMALSCLAFRGQLLADADDVNVFALAPSDFFVLIEEDDEGNDSETMEDSEEEETKGRVEEDESKPRKRRRTVATDSKPRGGDDAVARQLVEMGFAPEQARSATEIVNGDFQRALALLMGDFNEGRDNQLREFVVRLIRRYPELAAIESLLMNEEIHAIKKRNLTNTFGALMMLKESAPAHVLTQMNENPVETLLFLSVPELFETEPNIDEKHRSHGPTFSAKSDDCQEIDLTVGPAESGFKRDGKDQKAIDRLTAMGFDPDTVVAIYELCEGNEELAANLLFETLQ